jgi:hypothetical protein
VSEKVKEETRTVDLGAYDAILRVTQSRGDIVLDLIEIFPRAIGFGPGNLPKTQFRGDTLHKALMTAKAELKQMLLKV